MTVVTAIDETNRRHPRCHLAVIGHCRTDAVRAQEPVGKLPPAVNMDARAGTIVITDGRLVHSTGDQLHPDIPRIVMLNGMQHPVIRQQENWVLIG